MSAPGENLIFESGRWELHLGRRELRACGVLVNIGARAFEVIEVLVKSANELVTKNDLMDRIWPGAVVGENTLQVHISAIRKALGQDRAMLKTASGRGYRLLGRWTAKRREVDAEPVDLDPTSRTAAPVEGNLPMAVAELIGRAATTQHLRDLMSAYRIVTLTGPGGIGKTSLALEAARRVLGEFGDGGWLVELASLSDPDLVPTAVASVLGLKLGGGEISAQAVARAVGGSNLLLVLDNCEHLVDAAANFVETFVGICPRTTILVTSREVLRINGEFVYRVAPLEVPAAAEEAPDYILGRSAVELFVARAKALDSGFLLQADTLPAIGAICRHLDGIPLAIEFAAARAATLGVQRVAAGLHDRFALLTRGRRTALPRHQTLRATLDWSHELLPETERLLLRRLAIFPAGFTLDAAAAVMTDTALDATAVTDGIVNLVAKSLIMLELSEAGTRWYLLETTRAYALEKLRDSGEASLTARRQAEFYLALFAPFGTAGQLQAGIDDLERYRGEVDNLRAALNWAFSSDGDAALGVSLAAAAADFWAAASLRREACDWAGRAVAQIGDATGTRLEMILQCSLGITLVLTKGMIDAAREALRRALTLAEVLADFDYQQRATHNLWLFSARSSALDDALAIARQYDEVARSGDVQARAVADCWLGTTQIYRGAHLEAIERLQRAIDRYPIESRSRDMIRFGGDTRASAAGHIAVSLLSRGLLDTASRSATRAVEEARGTNQAPVLCVALAWAAGFIFLSLGELEIAGRYGDELIKHAHQYSLRPFHAAGLCVRGSLAVRQGDPNAGIDPLRRGLAEMREASYLLFYPFFLVELAAALGALGRVDDGLVEIDAALRFAAETGHRWYVPETLRVNGELFALRDRGDPAIEDCFQQAAEIAGEQGALFWGLRAALSLARLRVTQGRDAEVRDSLKPIYDQFTEGFEAADLRAARAMLEALPL